MNARPFDLALFDLDGTLVDSAPDIAWALNATLAENGIPTLSVSDVIGLVGDGAAQLVQRALTQAGLTRDPAPLLRRFLENYGRHLSVDSHLYSGVADLLLALQSEGIVSAVITNKPQALATELLRALGIDAHFAFVIGDGAAFPRKPDPAAAHSVIARTGVAPTRTVVLGDGLPDLRMARAVPCAGIAATWGYVDAERLRAEHPTFMAGSPREAAGFILPAGYQPRASPSRQA